MKSTFGISSLKKKTPDFWRRLGTSMLVVSSGAPLVINQFTFSPSVKDNLGATFALLGLIFKAFTSFFAEKK